MNGTALKNEISLKLSHERLIIEIFETRPVNLKNQIVLGQRIPKN